jgi:vancomycin permeability regulator SanA
MKQRDRSASLRRKRILFILVTIALVLASLPFAISAYVCASVSDRILSLDDAAKLHSDAILVLGARVHDNGKPSGILKDRLITGIAAYKLGASDRLLMSGDHGTEDYDEVNTMKNYALEQGVPSEAIFMDHAGFSTYESLYRARDVFEVKSVVIVTQRYHLYRALYVAERMGLNAVGVASDLGDYSGMPYFTAREILARCKDFCYTIFMPPPTYLGEEIPITANGNLTNG